MTQPKKRYRVRPLLSEATKGEEIAGIEIDATGKLKDVLVIRCDYDKTPERMRAHAFKVFREKLGQDVMILPKDWELCVFEEIGDAEEA